MAANDASLFVRYTVRELQSDIDKQLADVKDEVERERLRSETKLGIFVVHNKCVFSLLHPTPYPLSCRLSPPFAETALTFLRLKKKAGELPSSIQYFSGMDTPDVWLAYPWECDGDIEEHDQMRSQNPTTL